MILKAGNKGKTVVNIQQKHSQNDIIYKYKLSKK